ncbi:ABC transporter substrate-binding protein [Rhizobium sp. SSA_523]|uniref:ABC transporter substrate-binding protein n=1 Tax=Rhizobium sp. SSA_523 TaxID=2952477 RepID=UPI0020910065|nr:ABC transporter substrate-binding protein [Rhizobium sp. SSA_523]MCO5731599.1 ABC transporter substrate-binding protein [Rhizobium sp. SSA_523]WKC21887.1 ABC transporter substrate-binding protein [Rhizobium sp. SSA_523]
MSILKAVATAAGLLALSAISSTAQEAQPVRVGWLKASLSTIIQAIAEDENLYAANGLNATITAVSSGGNATGIEALMRGDFDVYYGPMTEMARLNAVAVEQKAKPPLVAVALGTPGATHLVLANDITFDSPESLRGKTIGVSSPGSVHLVMFRHFLEDKGLTTEGLKMNIVRIGGSDMVPALLTKQIDGFLHSQPTPAIAVAKGAGKIALAPAQMGEAGESPTSAIMVRRDWGADNPDIVRRVIATFMQASDRYSQLPESKLIAIVEKAIGAEEDVVKGAIPYVNPRLMPDFEKASDLYWKTEMAAMKTRGEVLPDFKKEDMFDASYAAAR